MKVRSILSTELAKRGMFGPSNAVKMLDGNRFPKLEVDIPEGTVLQPGDLLTHFNWHQTPQGFHYWSWVSDLMADDTVITTKRNLRRIVTEMLRAVEVMDDIEELKGKFLIILSDQFGEL